jgi:hypothetical protein
MAMLRCAICASRSWPPAGNNFSVAGGEYFALDPRLSYDPDGTAITKTWTQVSGAIAQQAGGIPGITYFKGSS